MLSERDRAVNSIDSILAWMELRKKSGRRLVEDFFSFKGNDTMQKKQSESPASDNGKNVHNGPTFLQIIMLWKKYYTINVQAYITLKHTLILKNIKQVKVLETTQKPAETDRESSLGIKEHYWMNFLFLQLFAWGQSLIGTVLGCLELRKKFPVLLALEISKERLATIAAGK